MLHWGEADRFSCYFKLPIKFETALSVTKKKKKNDDNGDSRGDGEDDDDDDDVGMHDVARALPTF